MPTQTRIYDQDASQFYVNSTCCQGVMNSSERIPSTRIVSLNRRLSADLAMNPNPFFGPVKLLLEFNHRGRNDGKTLAWNSTAS